MSKHTPGPWIAEQGDANCMIIGTVDHWSIATAWNLEGPNREEPRLPMEANAQLITAAPDLLQACEVAFKVFNEHFGDDDIARPVAVYLGKVIAKAKGDAE